MSKFNVLPSGDWVIAQTSKHPTMELPATVIMALGNTAPREFRLLNRDALIGSMNRTTLEVGNHMPIPDILHQPWFRSARYKIDLCNYVSDAQLLELRRGGAHGCTIMEDMCDHYAKRIFHPPTMLMSEKWANLVELRIWDLSHEVAQSLCELRALQRVIVHDMGANNLQKPPDRTPHWELIVQYNGHDYDDSNVINLPHHGYRSSIRVQNLLALMLDDPWAKHRTAPIECRVGRDDENAAGDFTVIQHGCDQDTEDLVDVNTVLTFMRSVPDDNFAPTIIHFWYRWQLAHVDRVLGWLKHPIPCIKLCGVFWTHHQHRLPDVAALIKKHKFRKVLLSASRPVDQQIVDALKQLLPDVEVSEVSNY